MTWLNAKKNPPPLLKLVLLSDGANVITGCRNAWGYYLDADIGATGKVGEIFYWMEKPDPPELDCSPGKEIHTESPAFPYPGYPGCPPKRKFNPKAIEIVGEQLWPSAQPVVPVAFIGRNNDWIDWILVDVPTYPPEIIRIKDGNYELSWNPAGGRFQFSELTTPGIRLSNGKEYRA